MQRTPRERGRRTTHQARNSHSAIRYAGARIRAMSATRTSCAGRLGPSAVPRGATTAPARGASGGGLAVGQPPYGTERGTRVNPPAPGWSRLALVLDGPGRTRSCVERIMSAGFTGILALARGSHIGLGRVTGRSIGRVGNT